MFKLKPLTIGIMSARVIDNYLDISAVFDSGEDGFWYDTTLTDTIYEDEAGTIPANVEASGTVRSVDDLSPNGYRLTESTDSSRYYNHPSYLNVTYKVSTVNRGMENPLGMGFTGELYLNPRGMYGVVFYADFSDGFRTNDEKNTQSFRIAIGVDRPFLIAELTAFEEFFNVRSPASSSDLFAGLDCITSARIWPDFLKFDGSHTGTFQACGKLTTAPELVGNGSFLNLTSAFKNCVSLSNVDNITFDDVSSLSGTFEGCTSLTTMPALANFSNCASFSTTWRYGGLTSFDNTTMTRANANFSQAWNGCTNLASFNMNDPVGAGSFSFAWRDCTSLTSFPAINLSNATTVSSAWRNCTSLTSFPNISIGGGATWSENWYGCSGLTSFPAITIPASLLVLSYTWYACSGLTSFPTIDTTNIVNITAAWSVCVGLTSFPALNLSSVTNANSAWKNCLALDTFNVTDMSQTTNLSQTWYGCAFTTFTPPTLPSSGVNGYYMMRTCTSLTTLPSFNFAAFNKLQSSFHSCTSLTTIPAGAFDTITTGVLNNIFSNCALDQTSVDNFYVSLDASGVTNGVAHTDLGTNAAPSATGDAAIANLISKGWTITTN